MTGQDLKNSILQLAIQGKLVERRQEEGTAKELIEKIQTDKKLLIKEGKLKKQKELPGIKEDEIPFDIPDSWEWVKLEQLTTITGGYAFKSTNYTEQGVRVIRISDFNEKGFVDNKIVRHSYNDSLEMFLLEKNNILLCMTGGTVGKSLFVKEIDEPMMTNQRVATIKISNSILPEYVNYIVLSPIIQSVIRISKNSTNDNISMDTIKRFPIPLPPLEEQKRIVVKIEELMPYVDKYDVAYSEVEELNKKFPEDMQKSILQYAIQGKLVKQQEEDGTAEDLYKQIQEEKKKLIKEGKVKKQKKLPEITEDEVPFDIPENWKWVRLGELLNKLTDGAHHTPKYTASGVPFISVKDVSGGKIDFSNTKFISQEEHEALYKRCDPEKEDILLTKIGTTGIPVIVDTDQEFSLFVSVALLKFNTDLIYNKYLLYAIKAPVVQIQAQNNTRGVGNKNWVMRDIANTILPLPPLEEQKRIVEKVEELLPYSKQLVK
ncbi:restriction endonuclease [Enterococcus casseliflavus]|uniref:restriction endonuclease subunit S n=1 Tax=Enterococcus casseliflavus TaxID=37734 RepID=UPI0009BD4B41|nr:restriction endonuclease subunit S [Enterococcus casseliflavus]OQO82825.1 restriction endonuclease [Enterococcus casseliflavus]